MSLVFRENAKNRQNHGVFEGAVMGQLTVFSGSLFCDEWKLATFRFH